MAEINHSDQIATPNSIRIEEEIIISTSIVGKFSIETAVRSIRTPSPTTKNPTIQFDVDCAKINHQRINSLLSISFATRKIACGS